MLWVEDNWYILIIFVVAICFGSANIVDLILVKSRRSRDSDTKMPHRQC
jgi:uncharacterized protein YybS (DUF2232 family)